MRLLQPGGKYDMSWMGMGQGVWSCFRVLKDLWGGGYRVFPPWASNPLCAGIQSFLPTMSTGTTWISGGPGWTLNDHSLLALVQHEGPGVVVP